MVDIADGTFEGRPIQDNGVANWVRGQLARLRLGREEGIGTAERIQAVEAALNQLHQQRETVQAALAASGEDEEAYAVEGKDFTDLQRLRAKRARAQWALDQLGAAEAPLVEELAALRSRQRAERLEHFQAEQRGHLKAGIKALDEAFSHFDEARDTWTRAASAGFEREMLTVASIWTADTLERLKSELRGSPFPKLVPQPIAAAPAGERQRLPHEAVGHGAQSYTPAPPVRLPARALRRDGPPQEGEAQVVFLRSGAELGNGATALAGDVINVPAAQAIELVRHSAADYTGG
jgi:hypothetical protein